MGVPGLFSGLAKLKGAIKPSATVRFGASRRRMTYGSRTNTRAPVYKTAIVYKRNPPVGVLAKISSIGRAHPFAFQLAVAVVKTTAADVAVQCLFEGTSIEDVNWSRVGVFLAFGCVYSGCFQYWMFIRVFSRMFPNIPKFTQKTFREKLVDFDGLRDVAAQIAIRNFVAVPLVFWPSFYVLREAMNSEGTLCETVTSALQNCRDNFVQDNTTLWKFWLVCDPMIFMLPLWLRLPVLHAGSFVWLGIVSIMRGAPDH